ncbi:ABC transporter permease [Roseomonas sp. NAR14]|uniref:ABC transporter permease n=1 Tax=Roseomonas acroporae TaxID=2937791 RepID=A0A9X2BUM5_9PROT|nr:ABC transporter permease [Roseomonas acroporae]MCK8784271.1 ABC transporter permease [Roseomonas acroporae]
MIRMLQRGAFRALVGATYLFLLAPLACVVLVSFNGEAVQSFPPASWSLRWYAHAWAQESFRGGLLVSTLLACGAALIATPLAVAAALGLHRSRWRGRPALEALLLAPLVVPGIVIGISLLIALAALDVREAPLRLLIGHTVAILPYGVRTVLASLARLDPALDEAAETLGAGGWARFRHVTLPLIRPGILAGLVFGLILSFDDVSVSLFLADARTNTLPLAIMSYLEYSFDPSVAAISSMLIAVTLGLAVLLERGFGLKRLLAG